MIRRMPVLINPFYFSEVNGEKVDFSNHYLKPFINRFSKAVRKIDEDACIFIESEPELKLPDWTDQDAQMIVNSTHWYDGVTLLTKNFNPNFTMDTDTMKLVFGKKNVRKVFYHQLKNIKNDSDVNLGGVPTVIGEFGIPYDLNKKRSYRSGDFSSQAKLWICIIKLLKNFFWIQPFGITPLIIRMTVVICGMMKIYPFSVVTNR